jgi:hypothetical protein
VLADERAAAMASADVLSHGVLARSRRAWIVAGSVVHTARSSRYSSASGSAARATLFELWAKRAALGSPDERSFNYLGIGLATRAPGRRTARSC